MARGVAAPGWSIRGSHKAQAAALAKNGGPRDEGVST